MKITGKRLLFYISLTCLILASLFYFTSPTSASRKQIGVFLVTGENKWALDQLKTGLEQAAKELDVELVYQEVPAADFDKQQESLARQLEETDGIITAGILEPEKLFTDEKPLIDLEISDFDQVQAKVKQTTTDYQLGATLGKALTARTTGRISYWKSPRVLHSEDRGTGLHEHLASGQVLAPMIGSATTILAELAKETAPLTLVLDDVQQLTEFQDATGKGNLPAGLSVYVLDFSNQVLAAIDRQEIVGGILQDNYSRGYQSLYQLVGDKESHQRRLPDNYFVTKDNLFSPALEPLVFPYKE